MQGAHMLCLTAHFYQQAEVVNHFGKNKTLKNKVSKL